MTDNDKKAGLWSRIHGNIFIRIFTNKYLIITAVFILIALLDPNGITSLVKNKREIAAQERSMRKYEREISRLEVKINDITTRRDSVERVAREEYYFHNEDEDVFIME